MGYQKPYTPEQRADRDEKDAQLREQARELIADPDKVAAMVAQMLETKSRRVLRYSLRNQALLINQAEERGTVLTDVDTYRGWRDRGRGVMRGETGYRIVRPVGREGADSDGNTEDISADTAADSQDGDAENPGKALFRMMTVFDIAQTDGVDDTAEGYDPVTVDDPAAELRATLTDQLERLGYTIEPGDVDAAAIVDDDGTHRVIVPHDQPVPELARALAMLVTRPKDERPTMSPPRRRADAARITDAAEVTAPDGTQRARLQIADYGTATVRIVTNWDTGATRYVVTGPRVSGTFTITPASAADRDELQEIAVRYGDHSAGHYIPYDNAEDLPTVNGVTIQGGATLTPDEVPTITHRRISARRPTGRNSSVEAPQKTTERTAATVRAILTHWLTRADLDQLHAAAARHAAPQRKAEAAHVASKLDGQIAMLTAERDQYTARAARYEAIATEPSSGTPADTDVTGDTLI